MPTLNWIGKDAVIRHHREVPLRLLEPVASLSTGADSGNILVQGDNLDALKALLPRYAGQVKCIYIDPPYNTGNEGWSYNDSVNSPQMRKWLGQVVGREDLDRHDRWLCMIYPRLILLRQFLRDDGAIFISIDDNEAANLKLVLDEIFGPACFIADISWQRTYSTRNDSKGIVVETEHILAYGAKPDWQPNLLPRTEAMNKKYKNPDNDIVPWRSSDAFAPGAGTHQGMVYAIQHPFNGDLIYPYSGACWRYSQDIMLEIMNGWCAYELKDLNDAEERARVCGIAAEQVRKGVKGIVLSAPLADSAQKAKAVLERGQWPRFYFTKQGKGGIARKTYLENVKGKLPTNLWLHGDAGHTDEAKKEVIALFGESKFPTPKPTRLIQRILQIATDKDDIILDSFAGSGTTGHAVLQQNAEDSGSRRFILVEMDREIAENVTSERLKRVSQGYTNAKGGSVAGLGGDFQYLRLSKEPLFAPDGQIREDVTFSQLAAFIWFMETKTAYTGRADSPLLGIHQGRAIYLLYNGILGDKSRTGGNTLTREIFVGLPKHQGPKTIYAAAVWGREWLKAQEITFKQTPYQVQAV